MLSQLAFGCMPDLLGTASLLLLLLAACFPYQTRLTAPVLFLPPCLTSCFQNGRHCMYILLVRPARPLPADSAALLGR